MSVRFRRKLTVQDKVRGRPDRVIEIDKKPDEEEKRKLDGTRTSCFSLTTEKAAKEE